MRENNLCIMNKLLLLLNCESTVESVLVSLRVHIQTGQAEKSA